MPTRRLGARECVPIYNALDPPTHLPVPPDPRFAGDLGFLGNRLPDREARVEEFFLRAAALMPQRALRPRRQRLGRQAAAGQRAVDLGHVYTADHNAFNCTPRAVLNVSRDSMARYGFSPATRVFEAAGAAACLITDAWEGIELFLEPGAESAGGARRRRRSRSMSIGSTPARARRIGEAARGGCWREHTYAHRAAQLESLLQGREPALAASR